MNAGLTGAHGVLVDEPGDLDGTSIHWSADDGMPPDEPFDDAWYDGRWLEAASSEDGAPADATRVGEPGWGPDRPPEGLPVVLWPDEALRAALVGAPGAGLARIVAEAADVDGSLSGAPNGDTDGSVGGTGVMDAGAGAGTGVLADLSDEALCDLVVACGRMQSWAAGIQARVVAERAARETNPLAHASLVGQVTGELVVTEKEGTEVVVRGESGAEHPTVIAALVTGRIDVKKAHTLLRSAAQLTVAERAEAIARYLPHAPRRTWWWLRNKMLAFAKTRHGSAESARAEAQRRSVSVDRAENDMGWLSAYLPATDAAAVWGVVDDMAHQLQRTAGEDRNLGQLRADSLTGIVTGRLLPADRFTDAGAPTVQDGDAGAGALADGQQVVISGDVADGSARREGGGDLVCTCGGKPPVVQHVVTEVVRPVRVTPTRPVVRVTVPASVLVGLDDAPGDLAGFGPIPAETARMVAEDATWQRLVTDPITGVLIDYSTTTYRPGRVLRGAVEARDGSCMFPSCESASDWCDLDHIEPFDHDHEGGGRGQTNAHNLHALCRRHHLLKTHAGWGVIRDPDTGVTTWTTPAGETHVRPPTVLDTHVEIDEVDPDTSYDLTVRALTGQSLPRHYRKAGAGADAGPDPIVPADPDEPPF